MPLSIYDPGEGGETPPPPKPTTQIDVVPERASLEIRWPNVLRIESVVRHDLVVDWETVDPLTIDPSTTPNSADLAPALGGATDMNSVSAIDLEKLPEGFRLQRTIFVAARKAFAELKSSFKGSEEYLTFQLVRLVESYLAPDRIDIPSLFHQDPHLRRILLALNMDSIVRHILKAVTEQNRTSLVPVFDEESPIGATGWMRPWFTSKPTHQAIKSHISHAVIDSTWESYTVTALEKHDEVEAYVKNDHLGFQVHYIWQGSRRRYVPDFIVRLRNDKMLALEIKGQDSEQNQAKRHALAEWVDAINAAGGFGTWVWDVAYVPEQVHDILVRHNADRLAHHS